MKIYILFGLAALFFINGCSFKNQWAEELNWRDLDFQNLPGQEEYPDAAAIILLDEGRIDVVGGGESGTTIYERHRIIKILNAAGFYYANVSIPYGSKSVVEEIQARTILDDGSITVLESKNIYDINLYPNFMFYSDQRAKIFTMPAVIENCILEYRYKVIIPGRTIVSSWNFQEFIPILQSTFKLVVPSSWEIKHKTYGFTMEPEIVTAPSGFKSTYIWKSEGLPALQNEFGMPPQKEVGTWITIAPPGIESWDDVSSWYLDLAEPRMKADEEIKKTVEEITKDLETDIEKLKAIYDWVQDRIRYISVAIGIGGFQPHAASEICTNRYGDCKDMATLLSTMANEAGIKTKQVLISTKQNGFPDTSLASPYQFNHVIAFAPEVGDSGIWMDATEKGTPFGMLPWYNQGLPVLIVDEQGKSGIKTTPRSKPDINSTRYDWYVKLGRKGQADIEGKTSYRGAMASELREELLVTTRIQRRKWFQRFIAEHSPGAILDTFFITGLDTIKDPLSLNYTFHSETFAIRHDRDMIIRPSQAFRMELPYYFTGDERSHPVRFRFGLAREFNLNVAFPPNWKIKSETRSDSAKSGFGEAYWQWESHNDHFTCNSGYVLKGNDIKPPQYKAFYDFLQEIRKLDLKEILLEREVQLFP